MKPLTRSPFEAALSAFLPAVRDLAQDGSRTLAERTDEIEATIRAIRQVWMLSGHG